MPRRCWRCSSRGGRNVDARIRSIESLAADKLDAVATVECRSLLDGSKPLTDTQRAAILTLQADLAVRANQPAEARTILSNLTALYPKQADPIKTKLILGQAKLRSGGEATAEGLALLKELAGQGDAAAAATGPMGTYQLRPEPGDQCGPHRCSGQVAGRSSQALSRRKIPRRAIANAY